MNKGTIVGSSAPFRVTALRWYFLSEIPYVANFAVEAGALRMSGVTFAKSLRGEKYSWSAAPSSREFDLRRACTDFRATAGMPDDADSQARALLHVLADGAHLFSQEFGLGDAAEVKLSLSDHLRLRLEWTRFDYRAQGEFGNARMLCAFQL